MNVSKKGVRERFGLPGTEISYQSKRVQGTIRFAHFAQMDDSLSSTVYLGRTTGSPGKSRCSNTKSTFR